jgi:hypothetical protein
MGLIAGPERSEGTYLSPPCKVPKEHRSYGLTISTIYACVAKFHLWKISGKVQEVVQSNTPRIMECNMKSDNWQLSDTVSSQF